MCRKEDSNRERAAIRKSVCARSKWGHPRSRGAIGSLLTVQLLLLLLVIGMAPTASANPVFTNPIPNDTLTGPFGSTFVYDFDATGSGSITFSKVSGPAPAVIHPTTGVFTYVSTQVGCFGVTIRATDNVGPTDYSFTIRVTNLPPSIINCPAVPFYVDPGETVNYDFNAVDPEADPYTFSVSVVPTPTGSYSINPATGVFQYTAGSESGTFTFTVKVTDTFGGFGECVFTVVQQGAPSACPSYGYAKSVGYYWPLPDGYGTTACAMRFTPTGTDTLKEVEICVHDPGDGRWGDDTVTVRVYADDAGFPGALLATKKVPPGSYVAYPDTTHVDFSEFNLVFSSDFHVSISTSGTVNDETFMSDNGTSGSGRSSHYYQGQWYPFATGGEDVNYLIWVTLCGAPAANCSTTGYAGTPAFEWPVPQGYTTAYAMRFSRMDTLDIAKVQICVWDPGDGSFGDDTVKVGVYADNAGLPGALLATENVPPGSYVAYPDTTQIDFSDLHLTLTGDFHVAISTSGTVDHETILSDSGTTGTGRSSYFYQGQWYPFPRGGNQDYNFHIWVTMCCPTWGGVFGHKYWDLDGDGTFDSGEPGVQDWIIEAYAPGQSQPAQTTTTELDGSYLMTLVAMPAADYYIKERPRSGWVQTAPSTVGKWVTVKANLSAVGPDFMNDSAWGPCLHVDTCLAGTKDNFVGQEASTPNSGLLAAMQPVPLPWFDSPSYDHFFGHTFANCWDMPSMVVDARLCMHLKALSGDPDNDGFWLGDWKQGGPGVIWGTGLNELYSFYLGIPNQKWLTGREMTVCLDLDQLNQVTGSSGQMNIIAALQDGDLDILIKDDTEVDYLELIVTVRCETAICGKKFNDRNGSGTWDAGEPVIANWPIRLYKGGTFVQTTTDANGYYDFCNPAPGTYSLTEVQNLLWAQTAPASGKFIIPLSTGMNTGLYNFGNWQPTIIIDTVVIIGGLIDKFVDPPDPGYQTPELLEALQNCSGGAVTSFDVPVAGQCFGHSFVDLGLKGTPRVVAATLSGRLKASAAGSADDGMSLGKLPQAGWVWGVACSTLVNITTSGADKSWDYGDTMTFFLDLGNLPEGLDGVTSVMPLFLTGGLDVLFSDDTEVDYLQLTLIFGEGVSYVPGDASGDGMIDISDAVYLIAYIFAGGPAPDPLLAGDASCEGEVDISDAVYLIAYIFAGGPAPCEGSLGKLSPEESMFLPRNLSPYSATLKLSGSDIAEGNDMSMIVGMQSDGDVAGVQLEFKADAVRADEIVVQTTERSANLQVFSGVVGGLFKVGLIDMTGRNAIAAGDGPIVTLEFKGDKKELDLVNAIICDRQAQKLSVKIERTEKATSLPKQFSLSQNYPNPFNPSTIISFALPRPSEVRLDIYNILGQNVRTLVNGMQPAGRHTVEWDGADCRHHPVPSGVYLYRLSSGDFTDTKKMLLLK